MGTVFVDKDDWAMSPLLGWESPRPRSPSAERGAAGSCCGRCVRRDREQRSTRPQRALDAPKAQRGAGCCF